MKKSSFDVIVVGAGPAGVAVAIDLSRAGKRVALVDKSEFPREKACAGILSAGTLRLLAYDASPVFLSKLDRIDISYKHRYERQILSSTMFAAATRRPQFDELGYRHALSSGCIAYINQGNIFLGQDNDAVNIRFDGVSLSASYLVAADGAASPIRRAIFPSMRPANAVSVEADINLADVQSIVSPRADFGVIPGGVAWAFPKGDHYNVGLYTYPGKYRKGVNRVALMRYTADVLGTDRLVGIRGFPISVSPKRTALSSGRVLFVGDAAGLAYAHNGEGIYGAVLSGRLAAAAILAANDVARRYQDSIRRYLCRSLFSQILGQSVYRATPLAYLFFAGLIARQVSKENARIT